MDIAKGHLGLGDGRDGAAVRLGLGTPDGPGEGTQTEYGKKQASL